MTIFARLLILVLITLWPSIGPWAEPLWKSYPVAEITLEAPADWRQREDAQEQGAQFVGPDGSALFAHWCTDECGRSERENILTSRLVVVDGRAAQLLHLKGGDHERLKLVVKSPTTKGRRFTLILVSPGEDLRTGSPLFAEIIKRLHFSSTAETAAQAPPRAKTIAPDFDMQGRLGTDCRRVDPASWHHPTLEPIKRRKAVHLKWVQLCAGDSYPVFGAEFDYDPQGQTNDFFYPLLIDALEANQGRPLAFVAIGDRLLIQARQLGKDQYDFNHAELDNPGAAVWMPPSHRLGNHQ